MDNQDQNTQPSSSPLPPPVPPIATPPEKTFSKTDKLKRSFFQILIGCLIGAASIAVVAVLVGSFNDVLARSLGTIVMVALHAAFGLSYMTEIDRRNKKDGSRSIELFSNTVFFLIVVSFITSIFAMWQLLTGDITVRLYMMYVVLLFATHHADILYRLRRFEKNLDNIITANYFLMAMVVIMLFAVILAVDASSLGEFFYRLLAALGITDATLTITAIIMHKLFLQKHPELAASADQDVSAQSKSFWKNPLVILLMIFLAFQIIGSIFALVFRGF